MDAHDTYWIVAFAAYAFDTEEQAQAFSDALTDAFCDMQEAKGYGASARVVNSSALPAVSAPVAVRVKPLQFRAYSNNGNCQADTPFGVYVVEDRHEDGWGMWTPQEYGGGEDPANGHHPTLEAAKAAAQADYAARIMAAIDAPDVTELVKALRECHDALRDHGKLYPHMVKGFMLDAQNRAAAALARIGGQ